ncbi:MAG TPA: hypothetical protein VK171_06655, partial [Fimbriimonas sp.]|nr:hypothetical protein [Fimbriimonas sp.]
KGIISPTESLRILVNPKAATPAPDPQKAKDILELEKVAIECNKFTNELIDILAKPNDRLAITETSTKISRNLTAIDTLMSQPGIGHLAQEFYSRFQEKSERAFRQFELIAKENLAIRSQPEATRPPLRKQLTMPLELLVAVNQSLNEVLAIAAEDALRQGTFVRVSIDLYRNNDLSRIPDTEFLAPADQKLLQALMKLRDDLRGVQDPNNPNAGTKPIDLGNMGRVLVRRFEAEYKQMFERIQGKLQDSIDTLNRDLVAIREQITDSETQREFEQFKREYQELVNRFQNILDTGKKLSKGMDEADASGNPQSDAALLGMWSSQLSSLKTESESLRQDTKLFTERFTKWVNALPTNIKQAIDAIVTDVKKLFVTAADLIRELADTAVTEIQSVIKAQVEFLNLVNRLDKIDAMTTDDINGRVEILNKERKLNGLSSLLLSYDELVIVVQAHSSEGGDYKPVGEEKGYRLGIFKNNRWDQLYSLTFSPRIGNNNRWQDALTYGQVFKKAYFSKSIHQNSFLPGFGWSMSVMDQNADSVRELGIGAMMTFFDDRLITGYGYNISEKHWYPYLGFRFRL